MVFFGMRSTGRRGVFYQAKGLPGNPETRSGYNNTRKDTPGSSKENSTCEKGETCRQSQNSQACDRQKGSGKA
jgi:hypothetical protein